MLMAYPESLSRGQGSVQDGERHNASSMQGWVDEVLSVLVDEIENVPPLSPDALPPTQPPPAEVSPHVSCGEVCPFTCQIANPTTQALGRPK